MRRIAAAIVGVFVATVLGAGSMVLGSAVASAAQGGTDRPINCSGQGTMLLDLSIPYPHAITGTNTADCDHLGLTQESYSGAYIDDIPPAETASLTGTEVAANGDQLHFTMFSTITVTSLTTFNFTNQLTYEGGTGRFQDASGSSTATGTGVVTGATAGIFTFATNYTLVGAISY